MSSASLRLQAAGPFGAGNHLDKRWRSPRRWAQALVWGSDTPLLLLAGAALREWVAQRLLGLLSRFDSAHPPGEFDGRVAAMRAAGLRQGAADALVRGPPRGRHRFSPHTSAVPPTYEPVFRCGGPFVHVGGSTDRASVHRRGPPMCA